MSSYSGVGSGSVRTSSPSVSFNPPELHPQGDESESSGSLKTNTSIDFEQEDVGIMNQSIPSHHETASSTVQENMDDTATSSRGKQRRAEEIGLLTDLYAFYNRTQHYSSIRKDDMQEFYSRQIHIYRTYPTEEEVDKKLHELYENYIKVSNRNAEAPTDPIDIEIFRLSSWIWEDDENSSDKIFLDDHGTGVDDLKDASNQEIVDDGMKEPKDSSKQETGDVDMKDPKDLPKQETGNDDTKDSKGLSKQETGVVDIKDSEDFPKETGDDQGGITGHDWKDSSGNEGGPSVS
ncbi:hypothetical protein L2E82_41451 [Cichorium intybus]|uniref:Uncharacterized protein n=1 Tax=Cichorium intybus TaxID=13427 RepID=A0ACB9ANV7_CICIN|nr:hypothetical protein L2E82_41451 [Cichorium intybus]